MKRVWILACAVVLVSLAGFSQPSRAVVDCSTLSGVPRACCFCDQLGSCEHCCRCETGLPLTACVYRCNP